METLCAIKEGDHYQILIEANGSTMKTGDPFEVDGPYVIVQRDFEKPTGPSKHRDRSIVSQN